MGLSLIFGLTVSTVLLSPLLFCARPSDDLLANSKIWPNSESVISQSTISLIAGLVPSRNAKSRISQPSGEDPGRESEGNKQKELVSSVGARKVLIKTPLPPLVFPHPPPSTAVQTREVRKYQPPSMKSLNKMS